VQIKAHSSAVFAYVSSFANDVFWRAEVKQSVVSEEIPGIGSIITQVSFLSKQVPEYITVFMCTSFIPSESIVCETTEGSRFWSKSIRLVTPLGGGQSKFTYQLEFDAAIVKHGLGFSLPAFIVSFYTRHTMKLYLRKLKCILEERN